jgi:hypothetical protein
VRQMISSTAVLWFEPVMSRCVFDLVPVPSAGLQVVTVAYCEAKERLDDSTVATIRGRRATEADSKHRFPVLESRPTEPVGPGVNRELGLPTKVEVKTTEEILINPSHTHKPENPSGF